METIKNFFKRFGVWVSVGIGVCLMLLITYDIIITNILSSYYCSQEPNPKTSITKKVEYPISIYWEDNVYPGFSKEDRALMIINYLDGKHLKTMALNGDNGYVYIYNLDKPIWNEFQKKHKNKKSLEIYKEYAKEIMKTQKIFTKQTMPKLNYTVTFNETKLNDFSAKFLYSDETKVIDNKTDETIAYNRRFMRFFYNIEPKPFGGVLNPYYNSSPICGVREAQLEYKAFGAYSWSKLHLGKHKRNLHDILIKRNKKVKDNE